MGIGEVSLTTLILAVVAGLAIGLAGWLWTVVQSERKRAAAAGEEFKTLQSTQSQVIHTTKLASLGQMIAGVAHELLERGQRDGDHLLALRAVEIGLQAVPEDSRMWDRAITIAKATGGSGAANAMARRRARALEDE